MGSSAVTLTRSRADRKLEEDLTRERVVSGVEVGHGLHESDGVISSRQPPQQSKH